jgi:hypothetical protein
LRKINFYLAFNLLYQLPGTVLCEDEDRSCPRKLAAVVGGLSLSGDFSFHSA